MLLQAFVCLLCFCLSVCLLQTFPNVPPLKPDSCELRPRKKPPRFQRCSTASTNSWSPLSLPAESQDCPPQDWLLGGKSLGGQFWVHQSSGLPTSIITVFFILSACYRFWVYWNDCHSVLWNSPCNRKTLFLTNSALDDVSCRLLLTKRKPGSYNQPKHANTLLQHIYSRNISR